MKNIILVLLLLLFFMSCQKQQWKMVWSDEFNYSGLPDTAKWIHEVGEIHNNELQNYTYRQLDNTKVENGNLLIIAQKKAYQGVEYTSARISTYSKLAVKYGKIEARIKLQKGKGIWPAFWLLGQNIREVGSPKCGEIDILEHVNNDNKIYSTMHWDNAGLVSYEGSKRCNVTKFHTYSIEWNSDNIKWFLDGRKYFEGKINKKKSNSDEFTKPFYIILNIAVGGKWPGNPSSKTIFPDTMSVDYVRVYQKKQLR